MRIVGHDEVFLSDSERLAAKAAAAGMGVTVEMWPEMVHVWHATEEFLGSKLGR